MPIIGQIYYLITTTSQSLMLPNFLMKIIIKLLLYLQQFEYSRSGNPTRSCLERCLAALDDAKHGLCFSSGLGATSAVSSLLSAGDHILSVDDIYGGTGRYTSGIICHI